MQMLDYLDSHRLTKEYMLRLKNNAERRSQYEEWMDHVTLTECRAAVERCVHPGGGRGGRQRLSKRCPRRPRRRSEERRPGDLVPSQAETTLEAEEEGEARDPPPASPPTPRESSEEAEDCAAGWSHPSWRPWRQPPRQRPRSLVGTLAPAPGPSSWAWTCPCGTSPRGTRGGGARPRSWTTSGTAAQARDAHRVDISPQVRGNGCF